MGFVIRGTLDFRIGSEKRVLKAGDTYVIPSHVPHEAVAGPEGATVADVFAPIRADWADLKRAEPSPGHWPYGAFRSFRDRNGESQQNRNGFPAHSPELSTPIRGVT
jgi:hypothetical protein